MSTVLIRASSYDYGDLKKTIFGIMDSHAGDLIQKGSRVIIKPNLLAPASPEKAIVTHPHVIKAVVEYVIQRDGIAQISDSPAVVTGSFEKTITESGLKSALKGLPVEYREFKNSLSVEVGKPFEKIEVAEDAAQADVLINLPKLKTHTQMLLTLGIKNLFGCVVGLKKPEWHLRTGVDREMFATLLVKVCQAVNPSFTLLDGILSMEGQGPGRGGSPRKLGLLMASRDVVAIDIAVCRMFGLSPRALLTNKIALEQNMTRENIVIEGELPIIDDFKLPEITPVVFGPDRFHGFFRRHLIQRPECDDEICRLCGECWQYCPAEAISHTKKKINFDYEKCIRCYCCIEVCPHGALQARETLIGRGTRKLLKI
ncbi:DUF362 domain-containing protein [bacterium]|nr:MAG: DUF362 domain-containing protein [bacterium]